MSPSCMMEDLGLWGWEVGRGELGPMRSLEGGPERIREWERDLRLGRDDSTSTARPSGHPSEGLELGENLFTFTPMFY